MPPHPSYITIKAIHHQIKPKLSQYPPLHITSLLQKCKHKDQLNQVHAHMTTTGLIHHPPLASKLIACVALTPLPDTTSIARSIACQINGLDTYTWNTIIRGFLEGNDPKQAILLYLHVRRKCLKVDAYTLLFVIRACGLMPMIHEGEQIHTQICKMGFVSETIIQTALLNFYSLFDKLYSMQKVFDEMPQRDIVMWNSLVAAYARRSCPFKALAALNAMVIDNVRPNAVTVVSVLSACSSLKALSEGKEVHGYLIRNISDSDVFVYNALIGMYSKCGYLFYARRIFQMMPLRNVVSWTSMINGYSHDNNPGEALVLFKEMESQNIRPDEVTMLGVVSMCSKLGRFELGEWIDHYIEKKGFAIGTVSIANALIDMHAKCGNIKKACQIFDGMVERTVVTWTSIIQGLAMHGHGVSALVRFCQMQREGFEPDGVVFLSILSACSHVGLVDEGRKCFDSMIKDYHFKPWMEHYGCMVDILCRADLINEAFEFIVNMPVKPDMIIWRILLGACQSHGDISLASQVMNYLHELGGPENCEDYVLLSNIYAVFAEWDNVKEVRREMKVRGVIKQEPGCSLIELNHNVHRRT